VARERIIVGMSGGVDSSVSALRLLEAGHEVEGLFMSNWAEDEEGYCQSAEDFQAARGVCELLGIPLHHADFSREYRDRVFAAFLEGYRAGVTPNPDVLCNREIKFGSFLSHALRLGAERIATGHYARTDPEGRLLRAADAGKDQTYFLHAVSREALQRTVFPIGDLQKSECARSPRRTGWPTTTARTARASVSSASGRSPSSCRAISRTCPATSRTPTAERSAATRA
jgi:tRNA-uridine 2-sulfurtransferase